MATTVYSSAQPLLALLNESDVELQGYALETLDAQVETYWSELTGALSTIEDFSENANFPYRKLAATVAAKIYFHLDSLDDALRFALCTDILTDDSDTSLFKNTLVSYCIDTYIAYRTAVVAREDALAQQHALEMADSDTTVKVTIPPVPAPIDDRIAATVVRMIELAGERGEWQLALGLAIDTRHLDKVSSLLIAAPDSAPLMRYLLHLACTSIASAVYRADILRLLVRLYRQPATDASAAPVDTRTPEGYIARSSVPELAAVSDVRGLCECLLLLGDAAEVATVLAQLTQSSAEDDRLLALQIAFDLSDSQQQHVLTAVAKQFADMVPDAIVPAPAPVPGTANNTAAASGVVTVPHAATLPAFPPVCLEVGPNRVDMAQLRITAAAEDKATEEREKKEAAAAGTPIASSPSAASSVPSADVINASIASPVPATPTAASPTLPKCPPPSASHAALSPAARVHSVLTGSLPAELHLHFLYSKARIDAHWFDTIRSLLEPRNATLHTALLSGASLAHAGTRRDEWLRDRWEWAEGGINWSRFTARGCLGAIYRGDTVHVKDSLAKLLPDTAAATNGANTKKYAESGALFALGLATAGITSTHVPYLLSHVSSTCEVTQHGACLGAGLAALGTGDLAAFESLRDVILSESAVAGEAAGYAAGCVFAGQAPQQEDVVRELLAYARCTQHEKTVRGVGVGLALMCLGTRESSATVCAELLSDTNPVLRYAGAYALALAYAATGDTNTLSHLLRLAVSDGSDDVRRAATIGVALVAASEPTIIPKLLASLAESYNPHVRHAVAVAIGLGCAGRKDNEQALAIVERLLADKSEMVRQGAFIGMGMLVMCSGELTARQAKAKLTADQAQQERKQELDAKKAKAAAATADGTGMTDEDVQTPAIPSSPKAADTEGDAETTKEKKKKEKKPSPCAQRRLREAIRQQVTRRGDTIAKLGALYAAGIAEAGGNNTVLSLVTGRGQVRLAAMVGAVLFAQYWYWQPLVPCLALALRPAAVVAVTAKARVPTSLEVVVGAPLNVAGYADLSEVKATRETKAKVKNVLSQTRKGKKKGKKGDTDAEAQQQLKNKGPPVPTALQRIVNAGLREVTAQGTTVVVAANPCRVLPSVQQCARVVPGRYAPVKPLESGVLVVRDTQPEAEEEVDEVEATAAQTEASTTDATTAPTAATEAETTSTTDAATTTATDAATTTATTPAATDAAEAAGAAAEPSTSGEAGASTESTESTETGESGGASSSSEDPAAME